MNNSFLPNATSEPPLQSFSQRAEHTTILYYCVVCQHAHQTQTDGASESKTDPEVLAGFDDWNDMPIGVARFLERVGADMEIELDNSDDSQVG